MAHADEDPQETSKIEGRYANYFKVGHNAFEFVLDFGQYYPETLLLDSGVLCSCVVRAAQVIFQAIAK